VNETYVVTRAPGAWPLLGHTLPLLRDALSFLRTLPAYGDLVEIRVGPTSVIVVCDADLTSEMLRHHRQFDRAGVVAERMIEACGSNVGTCPHTDHLRQRRLIQPAFHPARLQSYADLMAAQIDRVISTWCDRDVIDIPKATHTIASRILFVTMFGNDISESMLAEMLDDVPVVTAGITRRALMPPLINKLPIPANLRYRRAHDRLQRHVKGILTDHRTNQGAANTLLSILLAARDTDPESSAENRQLSDTEIHDNLRGFLLAGIDTTANAMAWSLHLISQHPDIQQRVQTEVDAIQHDGTVTYAQLPALCQLSNVLNEALRLYPPGWLLTRVTREDTELGGHPIPAGTTLAFSPYIIQHRADLYPHPERFDPDRWAERPTRSRQNQTTFFAFGGGGHKCPGDMFGRVEASLALATIIARWDLKPSADAAVRPSLGLVMGPNELRLRVTARRLSPLSSHRRGS
jgi:cytochrome P450